MRQSPICQVMEISIPITQGATPFASSPTVVAAVSEAGGLGTLETFLRSTDAVKSDILGVRALTALPFCVDIPVATTTEEVFKSVLELHPAAMSFSLGLSAELIQRAQDTGIRSLQRIHTLGQATEAVAAGADIIIAEGAEAGGFSGNVSMAVLVPQVVEAISPVPVIASGGIFDRQGVAAAFALGACGVSIGTRLLASRESRTSSVWRNTVLSARSENVRTWNVIYDILPATLNGYTTQFRALPSPALYALDGWRQEARRKSDQIRSTLAAAVEEGNAQEQFMVVGQAVGGIKDILPVAGILHRLSLGDAQMAATHPS